MAASSRLRFAAGWPDAPKAKEHANAISRQVIQIILMLRSYHKSRIERSRTNASPCLRATRKALVLRDGGIHFVRPGENSAGKIFYLAETGLAQKVYGFGAAHPGTAVGNDLAAGIQLIHPLGQVS